MWKRCVNLCNKDFRLIWGESNYFDKFVEAFDYLPHYENLVDFNPSIESFGGMGLKALELFHLVSTSETSPDKLIKVVSEKFQNQKTGSKHEWLSIIVSYSGLVDNPSKLANAFVDEGENENSITLAILILCSNYFGTKKLVERFDELLQRMSLASKIFTLRFLYQNNKISLAQELTRVLREQSISGGKNGVVKANFQPLSEMLLDGYFNSSLDLFADKSSAANWETVEHDQTPCDQSLIKNYSAIFQGGQPVFPA